MTQRILVYARARTLARLRVLRLTADAGKPLVAAALALQVLGGLIPVGFVIATSIVIGRVPGAVRDGLGSADWRSLRAALLAAAGLFVLQQLAWPVQWTIGESIVARVDDSVAERLVAASFGPASLDALQDHAMLDDLGDVVNPMRGWGFSPGSACAGLLALVTRYVQWAAAAIVVGVLYAWWAGVVSAAAALAVRIGIRSGVGRLGVFEGSFAPERRRANYFRDLLLTPAPAKELRIFGLTGWITGRYGEHALAAVQPVWRARRRIVIRPYLVSVPLSLVLSGVVTVAVARAAARGQLSLTELALVLQAIVLVATLGEFFFDADGQVEFGMWSFQSLERLEEAARAAAVAPGEPFGATGRPHSTIRFEDVWFAYPGREPVLRGLDLTIRAGESLAIVGLNGAGKTTLVKLLARFHEPASGRITVDGVDVRGLDARAWQLQLAAIFQDFVHYDLSLAENVAFGTAADERVRELLDRVGIGELGDSLPSGIHTVLSREYENGAELSGGQWQRVAIARALAAVDRGARVLVLDEPTANLDVRAEAEFFERFLDLTSGLTTVLISHRFSTVRRADRIAVLAGGRVVEEGTHGELLARQSHYAELFTLQAARFSDSGDTL